MHLNDVETVLDNAHNYLDDLWRQEPPYPKGRMVHLMDIIGKITVIHQFQISNSILTKVKRWSIAQ